jgi:hypothetical protein
MASKAANGNGKAHLAGDISFIKTPEAPVEELQTGVDCGVRVTNVSS